MTHRNRRWAYLMEAIVKHVTIYLEERESLGMALHSRTAPSKFGKPHRKLRVATGINKVITADEVMKNLKDAGHARLYRADDHTVFVGVSERDVHSDHCEKTLDDICKVAVGTPTLVNSQAGFQARRGERRS